MISILENISTEHRLLEIRIRNSDHLVKLRFLSSGWNTLMLIRAEVKGVGHLPDGHNDGALEHSDI